MIGRQLLFTLTWLAGVSVFMPAPSWAQDSVSARLHPSGMITLRRGGVEFGTLELNAHGPQWKHAPQATATAQTAELPDRSGRRFSGVLPLPNTDGGTLNYTQTVRPFPQGLRLEYDIAFSKDLKLNGLQFSLGLPVAQYYGKTLHIARPEGDPSVVTFPDEQQQNWYGWSGEGARCEVARGTPQAFVLELRAATDISVQDLRRWGNAAFEVRLPAVTEDQGYAVTTQDRFHLDLTITFPSPVTLTGP